MEETTVVKTWLDFPKGGDNTYLPCPICGRVYCDHPLAVRKDAEAVVKYQDGHTERRKATKEEMDKLVAEYNEWAGRA